jgi:hypothetical protein
MEPLHLVDKLNARSFKLPANAFDRPAFVTKCEEYAGRWPVDDGAPERDLSHVSDAQYV